MKSDKRTDCFYIKHMILHCAYILDDIRAIKTFGEFYGDSVYQRAASLSLLQIGEYSKGISEELKEKNNDVNWKGLRGFRNILAHTYDRLNWQVVWKLMTEEVPKVHNACKRILEKIEDIE